MLNSLFEFKIFEFVSSFVLRISYLNKAMNFNQIQRVILLFFLLMALCTSHPAAAAKSDYQDLVQRNLELRKKLDALEKKYAELENERNVLIVHVRNLQQEKEKLPPEGQRSPEGEEPPAAGKSLPAAPTAPKI